MDYGCWMCQSTGSVRWVVAILDGEPTEMWAPGISTEGRLQDDERTCPACKGAHRPRRTFFPLQTPPQY